MTCPARNQKLTPAACPEHILGVSDSRELLRCRACPRGQALMATVRVGGIVEPQNTEPPEIVEIKMMAEQTYTVKELAALLGVPPKDVANAKYVKSTNPLPGTRMAAVRDAMQAQGITWDQVGNPRGRKAEGVAANASPELLEEAAAPITASKAAPDAPEADLAGAIAGMGSKKTRPVSERGSHSYGQTP